MGNVYSIDITGLTSEEIEIYIREIMQSNDKCVHIDFGEADVHLEGNNVNN